MTRHDEIRRSYKALGGMGTVYDGIITRSTLLGKITDSLVWGLDKDLAAQWVEDALWPVPADFAGKLLDIKTPTLIQFNDSTAAYLQAG